MNVLTEWFEKARDVVLSPSAFYSEMEPGDGFVAPVKFAAISLVISGLLTGVVNMVIPSSVMPQTLGASAGSTGITGVLTSALGSVVGGVIGLFVVAAFIHIFVYLFGGRNYRDTFEVLSYATAVSAFLGWIPLVNILAWLYGIYVQAKGIESYHNLSFGKSLASVVLPGAIMLALAVAVIALWMSALTTLPA